MRVLFDNGTPRGWDSLRNGELLEAAASAVELSGIPGYLPNSPRRARPCKQRLQVPAQSNFPEFPDGCSQLLLDLQQLAPSTEAREEWHERQSLNHGGLRGMKVFTAAASCAMNFLCAA